MPKGINMLDFIKVYSFYQLAQAIGQPPAERGHGGFCSLSLPCACVCLCVYLCVFSILYHANNGYQFFQTVLPLNSNVSSYPGFHALGCLLLTIF